jgi:glycosyltransferase involved in cell wall biosynthesis
MKVVLVEPYYTGSHAAWADGLARHSRHRVRLLALAGRYWKWRMHGGSVTLAGRLLDLEAGEAPDLIVATDMLDLSGFLALTRKRYAGVPVALYFHENQLTYPWSPTDRDVINRRDKHYGFINYLSALCADRVLFNSEFHRQSFLGALPLFLKHFPDHNELGTIDRIRDKSGVLPPGIDLRGFDSRRPRATGVREAGEAREEGGAPVVLWNHRWEKDKNPAAFFSALYDLEQRGVDFRLVVLGERFGRVPAEFETAEKRLAHRVLKFGYADSPDEYASWLWRSDVIPVTSYQDFFGISIAEALYCECLPCLPRRLSYPELFGAPEFQPYFYDDEEEGALGRLLRTLLRDRDPGAGRLLRQHVAAYDWRSIIAQYDAVFEEMAG